MNTLIPAVYVGVRKNLQLLNSELITIPEKQDCTKTFRNMDHYSLITLTSGKIIIDFID